MTLLLIMFKWRCHVIKTALCDPRADEYVGCPGLV